MGKRGNGEGSIYRRKDGRWVGQYLVYTSVGPKYRYLYGKTRQAVAEKLTKAMADRDGGLVFDAGSLTVETYMTRWLSDSVKGTVRISTFERHEQLFRGHIRPALGRVKLKSLTPAHVRGLITEKLNRGLAPGTVRKIHSTLHKALSQAVSDGLVPRNAADVKAPQPAPEEMRPLSETEARAFLDAAGRSGDRFEPLYVLAITTGLRRGELLGLRWDDADLERGTLRVGRSLCVRAAAINSERLRLGVAAVRSTSRLGRLPP